MHVLECIGKISADADHGRDTLFGSRTVRDAILRNLQVRCESVTRRDTA